MDIKELKELIDATIYPNGEKKIKASSHQSMLHEIVDYTNKNITTINEGLEEVKNTLEIQGNDVAEQLKESSRQTELNNAKVNQKIDNLASNIVGLGGDIKGSVKGANVIELPNVAINGVSPKYIISGNTSIDGIQSVQTPMRVRSVGANLFSTNYILEDYSGIRYTNGTQSSTTASRCTTYMDITDGILYTNINFASGSYGYALYSSDKTYLKGGQIKGFLMNDVGAKYARITLPIKNNEAGWNHTPFEEVYISKTNQYTPYTESTSYITSDIELHSLPQVKDYVENGTLFKNVFTTKEFKKDDIRRQYINENLVNTYAFYFDIEENVWLKDGFSDNTNRIAIFSNGETYTCVGSTIATDVEDIVFFIEGGINYIMLKINRNKIDGLTGTTPLDKFKAYMGSRSLTIDYQANTEQVKLDTSGVVTTKANGTIFIENVKNVTDFYTANGLEVKDFKELVSIYKYEGSDLIQLDASKATFTTTLKHPDLTDGDLVFFEYKYLDSPLWGDNEIEYFNKNNVLQSENGKLWQKVETATNDGQLTTKLEEIK